MTWNHHGKFSLRSAFEAELALSVSTPAAVGIARLKASNAMDIAEPRLACSSPHKLHGLVYKYPRVAPSS